MQTSSVVVQMLINDNENKLFGTFLVRINELVSVRRTSEEIQSRSRSSQDSGDAAR